MTKKNAFLRDIAVEFKFFVLAKTREGMKRGKLLVKSKLLKLLFVKLAVLHIAYTFCDETLKFTSEIEIIFVCILPFFCSILDSLYKSPNKTAKSFLKHDVDH